MKLAQSVSFSDETNLQLCQVSICVFEWINDISFISSNLYELVGLVRYFNNFCPFHLRQVLEEFHSYFIWYSGANIHVSADITSYCLPKLKALWDCNADFAPSIVVEVTEKLTPERRCWWWLILIKWHQYEHATQQPATFIFSSSICSKGEGDQNLGEGGTCPGKMR